MGGAHQQVGQDQWCRLTCQSTPTHNSRRRLRCKSLLSGHLNVRKHQVHALLHLIGAVLVLPYFALAGLFLLIGEAARAKGMVALLDAALHHASWIFQWGIYSIPLLWLLVAVAGFFTPFKRAGALALCMLAIGSLLVLIDLQTSRMEPGQLLFLTPCFVVAATSAWLFVRVGVIGKQQ